MKKFEAGPIEKENQEDSPEKKLLVSLINEIERVSVDPDFKNDPKQQEMSNKFKENALKMVEEVLTGSEKYMEAVWGLERVQRYGIHDEDQEAYRRRMEIADRRRKMSHDALIAKVHSCVRYINKNLNQASQEVIEKWEEEQEESGQKILKLRRKKLAQNVIIPNKIDLHDRHQITEWAKQIFADLNEIKERLPR